MKTKLFISIIALLFLSACTSLDRVVNVIDDLTVEESYPITFNPEEEAYIDWYLDYLKTE